MRKLLFALGLQLLAVAAIGQFPAPYCNEFFDFSSTAAITQMQFGGVNNIQPANPTGGRHRNFLNLTAAVTPGATQTITVAGYTGGNTGYFRAFFDWNRDNDFSDQGEVYDIGAVVNSSGSDGKTVTASIAIPINAMPGNTRMRISLQWYFYANPCSSFSTNLGQAHDYSINVALLPACSGSPAGGTATTSDASVCINTPFQLSVSGAATGVGGLSLQWERSADGNNWQPVAGGTAPSISVSQTAATYYRRKISCGTNDAYSNTVLVAMKPFETCYCTPTVSDCFSFRIDSVSFAGMNNTSACSTNGYANYTATITPPLVPAGSFQLLSVKPGVSTSAKYVWAWIDFDQNGLFEASEGTNLGQVSGTANPVISKYIRIPFNAKGGTTRLRIQAAMFLSFIADPCSLDRWGETEDYKITIIPSANPNAGFAFYVNSAATGNNSGTSWVNAFTTLTAALNSAAAKDTIRVAKGTYKAGTAQGDYFVMKDSVTVLGGYPVTGNPADADRNWRSNPVLLSGEIGTASQFDDAYKILYGINLSAATVWDGFVVEGANGYGSSAVTGAMVLRNSHATVRHFIFRNNRGNNGNVGSALSLHAGSPLLQNCFFFNNNAAYDGKATVYTQGGTPRLYNCVFAGNASADSASALFHSGGVPQITNCTFFKNTTGNSSVATVVAATGAAQLKISNCIFYENWNGNVSHAMNTDRKELLLNNAAADISHSLFQNYDSAGMALLRGLNPRFRDTADWDGPDNLFFTADDGLAITNPCSPGLNAGANVLAAGLATDITGASRIFNNGVVDMGAYEVQVSALPLPAVAYVNKAATGTNDGSSWANAFTDMQKALQSCADTLKVAAGTYLPSSANPQNFFSIENRKVYLGGYPAVGNPTDAQRNPALHPTVLSGRLSASLNTTFVLKSKHADSTTLVDGFVIREAKSPEWLTSAGIYLTHKARPTFRNCIIRANTYGVLANNGSDALLSDCLIDSNYRGGLVINKANLQLLRCGLIHNTSIIDQSLLLYSGGGAVIYNASPRFDSCRFTRNLANLHGGALWMENANPTFNACTFTANATREYGGNAYNLNSNPVFAHCVFNDTLSAYYGGSMANFNSAPTFRFCEFRNSRSLYHSGLMYNDNARPQFTSCVFYNTGSMSNKNYSASKLTNCIAVMPASRGAAFLTNEKSRCEITNCTFIRQNDPSTVNTPSALIQNSDSSRLFIRNSILWGGKFDPMEPVADINDYPSPQPAVTVMENSLTQAYGTHGINGNSVGANPRLFEVNDADGLDNKFFTADDGLRLTFCSPALNTGNASTNTETSDILKNPRAVGVVDMGAYEFQLPPGTAPKTVYINAAATGANDGSTWTNAYTSLWPAINNICADTVKVAAGIYKPALFSRDSAFLLQHNKVFLGGYPATGNATDAQRNPVLHPTVLSGNIGSLSDSTDNSFQVVVISNADTAVTLDGFVIQDGYNLGQTAGLRIFFSKTTVRNCVVQNNTGEWGTGIGAVGFKRLHISNTIIQKNRAKYRGGGMFLSPAEHGVQTVIENSVIAHNVAGSAGFSGFGGGIYLDGNTSAYAKGVRFNNLIFYNNTAESIAGRGGGLYNFGLYKTAITNCTFVGNRAGVVLGSAIYNEWQYNQDSDWPSIYNSVFKSNSHAPYSEDEVYQSSDIVLTDCPLLNCYRRNIRYNRLQSSWDQYDMYNTRALPLFVNEADADGPDNVWLTADDGLRLQACSPLIDYGLAWAVAALPTDAIGTTRIINAKPDVGAYEFNGNALGAALPVTANDSTVANKEYTGADGWTHYYKDCQYLLSVKKNGKNIGSVGDASFRVKVFVAAPYGSGQATNLTAAQYNTPPVPWLVMNRWWNITSPATIGDSLLVRFPYTVKDFTDLQGANPALTAQTQIRFYQVTSTQNPFSLSVPASAFAAYQHSATPSLSTWTLAQQDSNFLCEHYIKNFGGGSAGTFYNGPLADVSIGHTASSVTNAAPNGSFTVSVVERNTGTRDAGQHKVNVYLSADNILTPGTNSDLLLGQVPVGPSLPAAASTDTMRKQLFVPCNATPGNYTLFFAADGEDVLAESNEQNNLASLPFAIAVGPALPPNPVISAAPSATVCEPSSVVLTADPGACPSCTYAWSNAGTGTSTTVYSSRTMTFTSTNACGSSTASQVVTILPQPTLSVTGGSLMCQFTPHTFTASGAISYTWTGPGLVSASGNTATYVPLTAGTATYSATGVGANGCSNTFTFQRTVNSAPAVNILQTDMTICAGNSVTLQATSAGAQTNIWSPAAGLSTTSGLSVTATPLATTKYYLTATSIMGCKAVDSLEITVQPAGSCTPQPDLVMGSQSISPTAIASGGSLSVSFIELNQGTAAAGAHKVLFYLSADNQLTPGANGDVLLGEHPVATLAQASNTGTINQQLSLPCNASAGNYFVFVVADGGAAVVESNETNNIGLAAQTLAIAPLTVTASSNLSSVCSGQTVVLTATSNAAATYSWSGSGLGTTTGASVVAVPVATGSYTVTASLNGCSATASITVTVPPGGNLTVMAVPANICPGGSAQLTASGANTYAWSPATGLNTTTGATLTASPAVTTTYTVTGTTGGCTSSKTVTVTVNPVVTPAVSIAFTGCPSSTLQFTATAINGGSAPVVQWFVNNTLSASGPSFTLNNATNSMQVYARLISNAACANPAVANSPVSTVNCLTTGIPNPDILEGYTVLPNPTAGKLEVGLKLVQRRAVSFELSDGFGKRLLRTGPVHANGRFVQKVDLSSFAVGTYFLRIVIGNESFVEKIVVLR